MLRNRLEILQADVERILRILTSTNFSDRLKTQILEDWNSIFECGGYQQKKENMTESETDMVKCVDTWKKVCEDRNNQYYLPSSNE